MERDKVTTERDQFQREAMEGRATIQQRAMQVEELQKEVNNFLERKSVNIFLSIHFNICFECSKEPSQ